MQITDLILLIPEKSDSERDLVADAWVKSGGQVQKIGRFWEPPIIEASRARIYGNDTFALVLAQKMALELVSPTDDLIFGVDQKYLKRRIWKVRLSQFEKIEYPIFIKPFVPKQFRAGIYNSAQELLKETKGLPFDSELLISEVIQFEAEARFFVHRNEILAGAVYEGEAELAAATEFVNQMALPINPFLPTKSGICL
jgi:hypothetical protein